MSNSSKFRTLWRVRVLALTLGLGLAAPGALAPVPARAQPTPYRVTVTGVEESGLRQLLEATSSLVTLKDETPPSLIGVRRRADGDRDRLTAALRSEGYYDGEVAITITEPTTAGAPATVAVAVTPGPPYHFRTVTVAPAEGTTLPATVPRSLFLGAALGIEPGAVARAPLVIAAEQRIRDAFAGRSFAFARVADRRVIIDRALKTMDITYFADGGPAVRLGAMQISGLDEINPSLVRGRTRWRPGELYRPELIEQTRTGLTKLGVFSTVRVVVADKPERDGTWPVTVTVTERKHHFIGAGATFSSADGIGAQFYWGHRNLFGGGEQFRLQADLNRVSTRTIGSSGLENADQRITAELRKPDFLIVDQDLVVGAGLVNENPQAYQRHAITSQVRLERRLSPRLTVGYGVSGEQALIREASQVTSATLAGAPVSVTFDTTDVLLDPTHGYRLTAETTPWVRVNDTGNSFMVGRVTQSAYYDLSSKGSVIAAGRLSLGAIAGGTTLALPADKRFFAGGGGSVRGYAYQKIGPVNAANDPTGGRSLIELSTELRIKVTQEFGIVPFIDGGNVYSTAWPQPGEGLRFGAGVGVRYYTGFGPLRLDIGTPLQPRKRDDWFQVYLSLGQAF